ncbi:hypothetical protein HNQ51_001746 [Inhella inkyongensis]|uniref:Uncharacterized protein n=1 Tax=Inhella inkyongensis TaxID=392593 RepID=A0A840S4F0_9BURK|nr:hypothetical protein [Inhella inkyongensis]MBB5204432.1 hypothetical protein [Inhella inkyongensis]
MQRMHRLVAAVGYVVLLLWLLGCVGAGDFTLRFTAWQPAKPPVPSVGEQAKKTPAVPGFEALMLSSHARPCSGR